LLQRARERTPEARLHRGFSRPSTPPRVGMVFPHFVPSPGLARGLYEQHPKYRQVLESCARVLEPELERPLLESLYGAGRHQSLPPSLAHAASVAFHYATYTLLRDLGVEPAAVYGAGAGEYAAAAAAGCLSWEQALRLAVRRGLVLEGLVPGAPQRLTPHKLRESLAQAELCAASLPFVSAALGRVLDSEAPTAEHFARQLYHEPGPEDASHEWRELGCDASVVLGPPGAEPRAHDMQVLHALTTAGDDWAAWLDVLAQLYVLGVELDFRELDAPYTRRKLSLPSYPFQRRHYWLDFPERSSEHPSSRVIERSSSHPLITRVRIHRAGEGSGGAGSVEGAG